MKRRAGTPAGQKLPPHEGHCDEEPIKASSDRAFGCMAGGALVVLGATKALLAGSFAVLPYLLVVAGAVLLVLGIAAPARLSTLNALWLKLGAAMAKVLNPIVLALLFFIVVTPMAFALRAIGKRPLHLAPDRRAASYWLERERPADGPSTMRRQF